MQGGGAGWVGKVAICSSFKQQTDTVLGGGGRVVVLASKTEEKNWKTGRLLSVYKSQSFPNAIDLL